MGGEPSVSWAGRAVSVRRGHVLPASEGVPGAGAGGPVVLVAEPGCWASAERAVTAVTGSGCRAVLAADVPDDVRNALISAGILVITLPAETLAKIQDTVEADSGIVLAADVDRGDIRARGELLARFEISESAWAPRLESDSPQAAEMCGGTMAGRLLIAHRLLCSVNMSGTDRIRLQRRLVAISDAMKVPGADAARAARRLERLLAELAVAGPVADRIGGAADTVRSGPGADPPGADPPGTGSSGTGSPAAPR